MSRERILAYLREVGPASAARVAQDLGLSARYVGKELHIMARLKAPTVEAFGGKPLMHRYLREPMPHADRGATHRERIRLTPEQRREKNARYSRDYYARNRDAMLAKRGLRPSRAKPEAEHGKPGRPRKPQTQDKTRLRIVTDAAFTPSALKHPPVDKAALPDTEAWIRENADKVIRLKPGECSVPRDAVTPKQRQTLLSLGECA